MTQLLLLVVVAVLGTLVGMVLLMAIVWACYKGNRKKRHNGHGRCCWQREYGLSHEGYGFPPHRDMIELEHFRNNSMFIGHQHQSSVSNNNTGVSKGLGLGGSYVSDQIPVHPAPRSWTPSPPFTSQQIDVVPRLSVQRRIGDSSRTFKSCGKDHTACETLGGACLVHTKLTARENFASPYNSYCKSKASDKCLKPTSSKVNLRNISLGTTSCDSEHSLEVVDLSPVKRKALFCKRKKAPMQKNSGKHSQQCRLPTEYTKNSESNLQVTKNLEFSCHDTQGNNRNASSSVQCDDQPAACSSPPQLWHSLPCSRSSKTLNNFPSTKDGLDYSSSCHHSRRSLGFGASCMLPQIRENSLTPPKCDRSTIRSPVMSTDHHGTRSRTSSQRHPASPITSIFPAHQPSVSQRDEIFVRDFSSKYGFCQSCGHHPDVHRMLGGAKMITRSTQTHWKQNFRSVVKRDKTQETTVDPTPSLSWDNLTPAPSPVLIHTHEDSVSGSGLNVGEEGNNDVRDGKNEEVDHSNVLHSDKENIGEGAVGGW